jgi:GAF domain-containing protein
MDRAGRYDEVIGTICAQIEGESDWIAVLSTVVAELHNAFSWYDWTGFYRVVAPEVMKVGPYQGSHGCLEITFDRGICGTCARSKQIQLVNDVTQRAEHIACSSSTRSEIVLPLVTTEGDLLAVLDIDSDRDAAFNSIDADNLERLCSLLAQHPARPRAR